MSVYKPKRSPFWAYDFVVQGHRHHGSTGAQTRRDAEAFERRLRTKIANGETADAGDLTVDVAAAKWFDERARESRSASDVERRLAVMARCIGPTRNLRDVTGMVVSQAIEKRRGMIHRGKLPANATVNRDIIAPLRAVLRRARRVWGARNMPEIAWGELVLPEAAGVVREFTDDERARWMDELDGSDQIALRLLLRYGLRFGELYFHPADVDAIGKRVTLRGRKAKEYAELTLPLLDEDARDLGRLAATALAAGSDTVWGLRYWQLYHRLRTAAERAKVAPGRIIHGARHHAATQIARQGGLHLAKRLLGHASITSTARYAHAMEDDLRGALESMSRNSPGQAKPKTRKRLADQGDG